MKNDLWRTFGEWMHSQRAGDLTGAADAYASGDGRERLEDNREIIGTTPVILQKNK